MYTVKTTKQFEKDVRLMKRRGYDISLLTSTIEKIAHGEILPSRYRDHALTGNWSSYRGITH